MAALASAEPGCAGVDTESFAPSRIDGLVHHPGSRTPKPAASRIGAASDRNPCAPSASRVSDDGLAVRKAPSMPG